MSEAVEMEGSLDRQLGARHRYVATTSLTPHFANWSYERGVMIRQGTVGVTIAQC